MLADKMGIIKKGVGTSLIFAGFAVGLLFGKTSRGLKKQHFLNGLEKCNLLFIRGLNAFMRLASLIRSRQSSLLSAGNKHIIFTSVLDNDCRLYYNNTIRIVLIK